jgi:catechol 2,3-dioxygenase-like lactoylglutathione lyase family enzyme
MGAFTLAEIVIDVPTPHTDLVQDFYQALTGYTTYRNEIDNPLLENANGVDLGFQRVEAYQGPTWPTQERGQQLHLDFATDDIDAAVRFAVSQGATRAEHQPGDDFVVMRDPVGHPFCFVRRNPKWDLAEPVKTTDGPSISLRALVIDCPDNDALADFYLRLYDGERLGEGDGDYTSIRVNDGLILTCQRAEGYQPPTWPTQERGQQLHCDVRVEDKDAAVAEAISLGATIAFTPSGGARYVVMRDPAGHPFCIGGPY